MAQYFNIPEAELDRNPKIPILKLGDSGEVFYELALEMIDAIRRGNEAGRQTVIICPVGPVGQYPIFVRLVNRDNISLRSVWFINMDEYLDANRQWIAKDHKLSFRGFMDRAVYSRIKPELVMPEEQRVFPDPENVGHIPGLLEKLGGVDLCVGGIGINGHLAFNEPQPIANGEFAKLPTRVLKIACETRTINAVGDLDGAVDAMPTDCVTIGMKEILSAKKIRLGVFRDWHRAVIRQAAYGEATAQFPASLLQSHPDAQIITNANAARQPQMD